MGSVIPIKFAGIREPTKVGFCITGRNLRFLDGWKDAYKYKPIGGIVCDLGSKKIEK